MIDYRYLQQNKQKIEALLAQHIKGNNIAAEAGSPHLIRVRLMNEGFELVEGTSDTFVCMLRDEDDKLTRPDEIMIVRDNYAYQVLDRHVQQEVVGA